MSQHTEFSSYREILIEHLFLGELLKISWLRDRCSLEIAKPEVDNSGYDAIVDCRGTTRHLQLKTSVKGGKAASQKVHEKLSTKPSACVVWICFDEKTLELGPFLFFGSEAGDAMPSISGFKTAKHTKANKDGFKAERPKLKVIPKSRFDTFTSIDAVYERLFGPISS